MVSDVVFILRCYPPPIAYVECAITKFRSVFRKYYYLDCVHIQVVFPTLVLILTMLFGWWETQTGPPSVSILER